MYHRPTPIRTSLTVAIIAMSLFMGGGILISPVATAAVHKTNQEPPRFYLSEPVVSGNDTNDKETTPAPTPGPQTDLEPAGDKDRLQGDSRVETAIAVANDLYPNAIDGVIVARSDVFADSISAAPLAKALGMPVLLTQSEQLHTATATEIKRLLPDGGTAYLMGGDAALSPETEQAIKTISGKTERIAGENRAGTAVATANHLKILGKLKRLIYADGTDWQPTLISGPLAAQTEGAILLTWGEELAPESQAFMMANAELPETAVGTKAAVSSVKEVSINEDDPTLLSMAVIGKFFKAPTAVGIATVDDFADALSGGAHIATLNGPIILVGKSNPPEVLEWIKNTKSLKRLVVYGGETRITAAQEAELRAALQH